MNFLLNLGDSKSPHVPRILLAILTDLKMLWSVWFQSSSLFSKPLGNIPSTLIIIGITVTFMFNSIFNSLARSKYTYHTSSLMHRDGSSVMCPLGSQGVSSLATSDPFAQMTGVGIDLTQVFVCLFLFLYFQFVVCWKSQINSMTRSFSCCFTLGLVFFGIRWSVYISKYPRILRVIFSNTDSGLCIYHLVVWSKINILHNSLCITFPI